ncbi:MAG: dynamin family protein [Kineosporiaceae bacterium]
MEHTLGTAVPQTPRGEEPVSGLAAGPPVASDLAQEAGYEAAISLPADDEEPLDLLEAAELLRIELGALRLPLTAPGVEMGRKERDTLITQLDDYLLPRLRRMDAPVLAVVGGSTGAGKSTLVNSLVRREVTRSGVLRPTTRSPVLVHHPYDSGAFLSQRILPGLARVTSEAPEPAQPIDIDAPRATALRLVPHEGMPPGIAIVDAPDIDSLVETNRELAMQLLAAADLWIFVTTAARYADAVPWEMLRQAVERGVSVAVVLDRVPPEAMQEVRTHLATLLRDRGLATSPVFTIPETERSAEGFLPKESVQPLIAWLTRLSRDARSRDVVIRRTLVGALDSLRDRIPLIATSADEQVGADEALRDDLDAVYTAASDQLEERLCDGTMMRGELLARWQEFVGTGELFRSLDVSVSTVGDRLGGALRGHHDPTEPLDEAVRTGVHALVRAAAQRAADDSVHRWRARPEGSALLDAAGGGSIVEQRVAPDFDARLARTVRDWQAGVLDLVRDEGASRRAGAKATSLGVNATGLILMLTVFTHAPGSTEAEDGVAAGTAAVAHRVLEAVFGDQSVRALTTRARADLIARSHAILDGERARIEGLLDRAEVRDGRGEMLRALANAVEEAR